MKSIYFISDAHLGCRAMKHGRTRERRLVRFLDAIKEKAEAVYMLGDMFDFWFEYTDVVPKGFTRFLGKVSELTDSGIEVHYFLGNHDMWCGDYLEKECGVIIHREPCTLELHGREFYLDHGHHADLGSGDRWSAFMFRCFESRSLRRLARMIHPHWFMTFGNNWATHSRQKHERVGEDGFKGEDRENIITFAKTYLTQHPTINYFIFGHRHIELDCKLSHDTHLIILGEWYNRCTYAEFDGEYLYLSNYVEGDTQL